MRNEEGRRSWKATMRTMFDMALDAFGMAALSDGRATFH